LTSANGAGPGSSPGGGGFKAYRPCPVGVGWLKNGSSLTPQPLGALPPWTILVLSFLAKSDEDIVKLPARGPGYDSLNGNTVNKKQ